MLDENWIHFAATGRIEDYLKYKENEKAAENANNYQGLGDTPADSGGE